jgi:hypothetical protein
MYSAQRGSTLGSEIRKGVFHEADGLSNASGVNDDHRARCAPTQSAKLEDELRDFGWVQYAIDSISEARAHADELERRSRRLKAASANGWRPLFPESAA